MNATQETPLDYERFLKDMCYNKEDLASKLINLLINERGPKLFNDLTEAVNSKNSAEIASICHTIKGTSANMCADMLSLKAAELNEIAQNGESNKYEELFEEMKQLFSQIVSWWKDEKSSTII